MHCVGCSLEEWPIIAQIPIVWGWYYQVNAHLVNWPNLVHILAHTQIVSDRGKVVAISLPSSALGHKESCTSPSLQYVYAKARLAQHLHCWSPHLLFNLMFVVLKLQSIHRITRKITNGQKHAISISQSGNQGGNAMKRR